jgi:imidazolonepropionase-like amidohydrolase
MKTLGLVFLLTAHGSLLTAQTIAITGGTVYPVSGPKIERGTVLIRDGRIVAVGANVTVPGDAQRVDATGKWVTPGFIFAGSDAGTGVSGLFQLNEGRKQGDVNASFTPAEGIDPLSLTVGQTRTGGVTTTISTPGGQFITGTASAIDLAGASLEEMLINRSTALVIDFGEGAKTAGGGSRAGGMARLRQVFNDALEYDRRKAEYNRGATQELSAPAKELEALLPALRGRMPVVALANRRMDIENALRVAREFKLRLIVAGSIESWLVARELAAANVPVMIQPNTDIPSFNGLQARLDIATASPGTTRSSRSPRRRPPRSGSPTAGRSKPARWRTWSCGRMIRSTSREHRRRCSSAGRTFP